MKKSFSFPRSLRVYFLNHKWVLDIVKFIFCIYWYGHIVFLLWLIDVMEYMNWFSNVEVALQALHIWEKSHMLLLYDSFLCIVVFDMLIFCWGFFCIYVYQTFVLVISSFPFLLSFFSFRESRILSPFLSWWFFSCFEHFSCEVQFDSKLFSFIC